METVDQHARLEGPYRDTNPFSLGNITRLILRRRTMGQLSRLSLTSTTAY